VVQISSFSGRNKILTLPSGIALAILARLFKSLRPIMKNSLRHIFSLLLLGALCAFPVHADDLTPTQVAALYLKAILEDNLESVQKINHYLHEGSNGEDTLDFEWIEFLKSYTINGMMEDFMDGEGTTLPELEPYTLGVLYRHV
jgi:hypothetical protein